MGGRVRSPGVALCMLGFALFVVGIGGYYMSRPVYWAITGRMQPKTPARRAAPGGAGADMAGSGARAGSVPAQVIPGAVTVSEGALRARRAALAGSQGRMAAGAAVQVRGGASPAEEHRLATEQLRIARAAAAAAKEALAAAKEDGPPPTTAKRLWGDKRPAPYSSMEVEVPEGEIGWGDGSQKKWWGEKELSVEPLPDTLARAYKMDGRAVHQRCGGFLGQQCLAYYYQPLTEPSPTPPAPKGSCPGDCNGVGVCNAEAGVCMCPVGYNGTDCGGVHERKCNDHIRDMWSWARCTGECDSKSYCWCPKTSKHPERPFSGYCQPYAMTKEQWSHFPGMKGNNAHRPPHIWDDYGNPLNEPWPADLIFNTGGKYPWDRIFSKNPKAPGWCEVDAEKAAKGLYQKKPIDNCPCIYDGYEGTYCEIRHQMFCINDCSGHGRCDTGLCHCEEGWFGTDCSLRLATLPSGAPGVEKLPDGHLDPIKRGVSGRARPWIYVYDMPPEFTTLLLQYRGTKGMCTHRLFDRVNQTSFSGGYTYSIETALHEMLLNSPHRTLNPEEADFFYVPVYVACLIHPAFDYNNEQPLIAPRPLHAMRLLVDAQEYISKTFPYWNRRGGKDHMWLMPHDEGACWAPKVIFPSIMLTHWGRLDEHPDSSTAYVSDIWTHKWTHPIRNPSGRIQGFGPTNSRDMIGDHPCYVPDKDIVLPVYAIEGKFARSPYMWECGESVVPGPCETASKRPTLLFFAGRTGLEAHMKPNYSRGVRQLIFKKFKHTPGFKLVEGMVNNYSDEMRHSKFCLVPPGGDGWSSRGDDSIRHGCVPVIIQDGVQMTFETMLDYNQIGVRIEEKDVERLDQILNEITPADLARRRRLMRAVWRRFTYLSLFQDRRYEPVQGGSAMRTRKVPYQDDALDTIIQALMGKLLARHDPGFNGGYQHRPRPDFSRG